MEGSAEAESIFPIMDETFSWLRDIDPEIRDLHNMVQGGLSGFDIGAVFTVWENLLKHEATWYEILGKNRPTRILLLNQNSDELRAGGGFPGTAFIIEFDE